MNKVSYLIKQLFPLDYYTKYHSDGKFWIATWKQQFGRPYNICYYKVCA